MIEKCTAGFVSDLDLQPESFHFATDLLLVSRKYKLVRNDIEPALKERSTIGDRLSPHDRSVMRGCKCCLVHFHRYPRIANGDRSIRASRDLFIYVIEALRIIKSSNAVDLFVFEFEKTAGKEYRPVDYFGKRQPQHELGLKKHNFTTQELRLAKTVFEKIANLHRTATQIRNRLVHAIVLYNKAIFTEDQEVSYLMFVTLLECLLSPKQEIGELRYSLCQRVSWFLAPNGYERQRLFLDLKKMYDIRSKIVHGADVKPKLIEGIRATIIDLREICRRILEKIFHNEQMFELFAGHKNEIESYLRDLTLNV